MFRYYIWVFTKTKTKTKTKNTPYHKKYNINIIYKMMNFFSRSKSSDQPQKQNQISNPQVQYLNAKQGLNVPIDAENLSDPASIRKLQSLEHCFINCIAAFSAGDRVMNTFTGKSNKDYRKKVIVRALTNVLDRAVNDENIGSVSVSQTIKGDFKQLYNVGKHGLVSAATFSSPQQLPKSQSQPPQSQQPQGGKSRKNRKSKKSRKSRKNR